MNNVGVLKTQDGSTIFNNRLSWFIYTPTEKSKNYQENQYFLVLYIKSNQYRTKYRQTPQKSALSPITHPNPKPQSKSLSSYINTKTQEKSTLLPITNFSLKITTITSNSHLSPIQKENINM